MKEHNNFELILRKYIPQNAVPQVIKIIEPYNLYLKIVPERKSKLGDYYCPYRNHGHIITINSNLNQYRFLITLLHEIAHLKVWDKFHNSVAPHGKEWKNEFREIITIFLNTNIFPENILNILSEFIKNPQTRGVIKMNLNKELQKYDANNGNNNYIYVEDIPLETKFSISNKTFIKISKIRTRWRCISIPDGKTYLVNQTALATLI
jgi:hypothetical protein